MRAFALLFAISAALVLVAACENVPDAHPAAPTATNTTGYAYPPPQGYGYPPPGYNYPPPGYQTAQPSPYPNYPAPAPPPAPQPAPAPTPAPAPAPTPAPPPAPPPTPPPPAPTGSGTLATPGPLALPCQSDANCGTHKCNTQYGKCAFPCATAYDCTTNNCVMGVCMPGGH